MTLLSPSSEFNLFLLLPLPPHLQKQAEAKRKMVSFRSLALVGAMLASASLSQAQTVTFDCTKVPNICSNDCESHCNVC